MWFPNRNRINKLIFILGIYEVGVEGVRLAELTTLDNIMSPEVIGKGVLDMSKKFFLRKTSIIVISVAVFLSLTFFLYWRMSNNTVIVQEYAKRNFTQKPLPQVSTPGTKQTTKTPDIDPKREAPQISENLSNDKEVEEAISFLDSLSKQSHPAGTDTNTKGIELSEDLSQDELFEFVREGVSYYDSFVESASVDFTLEITSADYPGITRASSGTWEGVFEFSGSQIRGTVTQNATQYGGERGDIQLSVTREFAYNGETFETLRETPNGTLLTRGGDIAYNISHDPRFWGWNLSGDKPLVDLIESLDIESIQPMDWEGSRVYHLKGSVHTVGIDLWLNPEKSFRPERFICSTSGEDATIRVTKDFNFQEVAPDLWFPESAQAVTTIINDITGEEANVNSATMSLGNVRINEPIPISRFSIDPPSGATVFDMRSRETYKEGN